MELDDIKQFEQMNKRLSKISESLKNHAEDVNPETIENVETMIDRVSADNNLNNFLGPIPMFGTPQEAMEASNNPVKLRLADFQDSILRDLNLL